jgi:hypothetical protein
MLGWTPEMLYRTTLPEFLLALKGWQRANGYAVEDTKPPMTRQRLDEILERYT